MASSYDQVEMLRSNKGGAKIIHKGYLYTVHKRNRGRIRWRCAQRALCCKGSITTGGGPPVVNLPHNHIPDMQAIAQARCRNTVVTDENEFLNSTLNNLALQNNKNDLNASYDSETEDSKVPVKIESSISSKMSQPTFSPPNPTESASNLVRPETEMCLKWNNHYFNMQNILSSLMKNEKYVDVTLGAEGQSVKCHRLILSSCSDYFEELLEGTHPMQQTVVYLRDIPFWAVKSLVDFMYKGEVNIEQGKLDTLLAVAEELRIKGLAGKRKVKLSQTPPPPPVVEQPVQIEPILPPLLPLQQQQQSTVVPIPNFIPSSFNETALDTSINDDDYSPILDVKKKNKRGRKRKVLLPPDPSMMKQVKINLKGTKSRPNIKQPKYYDPDYPEYSSERCASPPKVDADPEYSIDNVKMEPIEYEEPSTPKNDNDLDTLLTENPPCTEKETENETTIEKINTSNSTTDGEQITLSEITVNNGSVKILTAPTSQEPAATSITNSSTEIVKTQKELSLGKKTIILNVKRSEIQNNTSLKKLIESAKQQVMADGTKMNFPQIRVRNLSTGDNETVLKKFATTQLTSILKKDQRILTKPKILWTPVKSDSGVKKKDTDVLEGKLTSLAKTKKELALPSADEQHSSSDEEEIDPGEVKSKEPLKSASEENSDKKENNKNENIQLNDDKN